MGVGEPPLYVAAGGLLCSREGSEEERDERAQFSSSLSLTHLAFSWRRRRRVSAFNGGGGGSPLRSLAVAAQHGAHEPPALQYPQPRHFAEKPNS
nr:unnamed protein product [Digitaria exilis]